MAGRPRLASAKDALLTPRDGFLREENVPVLKNSSFRLAADLETDDSDSGVLIAQGSRFGGWSLYVDKGRPAYVHNFVGAERYVVTADRRADCWPAHCRAAVRLRQWRFGKGGDARLLVDGAEVGAPRIERTVPFFFSADETLNAGIDRGSLVTDAYPAGQANRFTGILHTVRVAIIDDTVEPTGTQQLKSVLAYH